MKFDVGELKIINNLIIECNLDEEEFFIAVQESVGAISFYVANSDYAEFAFADGSKASIKVIQSKASFAVSDVTGFDSSLLNKIAVHISGFAETETREIGLTLLSVKPMKGIAAIGESLAVFPVNDFVRRGGVVGLEAASEVRAPHLLQMSLIVSKPKRSEAYRNRNHKELQITKNFLLTLVSGIQPFPRLTHERIWVVTGHDSDGLFFDPLLPSIGFIEEPNIEFAKKSKLIDFVDYLEDYDNALLIEDRLQFPIYAKEAYEVFRRLEQRLKDRFARSMFFFCQGEILRSAHMEFRSAYVSSIEALLEPYKEKCPECKQDRYSLTRRFADFMNAYAPYSAQVHQKYTDMYKQRSLAVHGVYVPEVDSVGLRYDRAMIDNFLFPWRIRQAIIGYLLAQAN